MRNLLLVVAAALLWPCETRAQEAEWASYIAAGRKQEAAGNLKLAEKHFTNAVSLAASSPSLGERHRFESREHLARVFQASAKYEQAAETYEDLLQRKAEEKNSQGLPSSIAALQLKLALARSSRAEFAVAEKWCLAALAIEKAEGRSQGSVYADGIRQLAGIKRSQGKYGESEKLLKDSSTAPNATAHLKAWPTCTAIWVAMPKRRRSTNGCFRSRLNRNRAPP